MPILFLVIFVVMAGFAALLPSIMYVLENLGTSQAAATPILASYSFAQFIVGPLWGRLSDRFGRRPMLLLTLAGSVLSYLYLANFNANASFILVGFLLAGIWAGNTSVVLAAVADITTAENRAKGMGMVGAGIGLAFTVGPFLGAMIGGADAASATIGAPSLLSASLCALGFIVVLFRFKETLQSDENTHLPERISRLEAFARIKSRPILLQICLMMLFFTVPLAMMESILSYFMETKFFWGPPNMGKLFLFIGLVLMIVQGGLIGRLNKRFGERSLARAGVILMGSGLFGIVLAPTTVLIYVAVALTSAGTALFNTSTASLVSHRASASERGAVMGVFQSMQSLGRSTGPLIAGLLNQQLNGLPMLAGGGIMFGVLVWMLFLYQKLTPKEGM